LLGHKKNQLGQTHRLKETQITNYRCC